MDPNSRDVDSLLATARDHEGAFRWQEASECYEEALQVTPTGIPERTGDLQEAVGHALYRAAFQLDRPAQFRERMAGAGSWYERARGSHESSKEPAGNSKALRCKAMLAYIEYWIASDPRAKRKAVTTAWGFARDALKAFDHLGDAGGLLVTFNLLNTVGESFLGIEENLPDLASSVAAFEEMLAFGERAIQLNRDHGNPRALAEAYVTTAICLEEGALMFFDSRDRRRESRQRAREYWLKANELSREAAAVAEWSSFAHLGLMYPFGFKQEEYMAFAQDALALRRKTRDKYIIGVTLEELGCQFHFMISSARYPDEREALGRRSLEMALEAAKEFSAIAHTSLSNLGFWSVEPYSGHYSLLAFFESDLKKKRALASKALETVEEANRLAEAIGEPYVISNVHGTYGFILTELAKAEANSEKKAELLKEALRHRRLSAEIHDRITPLLFWNRGLSHSYLAETQYELSRLATDRSSEVALLSDAIAEGKSSLELLDKEFSSWIEPPSPSDLAVVAFFQYGYGTWLLRLWELDGQKDHLQTSAETLERAAESFQRAGMRCRNAESNWTVAQVYIALEEHTKSSEKFGLAAGQYKEASAEMPGFAEFYRDYSMLMEAWSEIEKARDYHARQQPAQAKAHYEAAAQIHGRTRRWGYLQGNYLAWAEVENAESLSHMERDRESIAAFRESAELFEDSKHAMLEQVARIDSPNERRMVEQLIEAADRRCTYCVARMTLEEARSLDKQGDTAGASEKYGLAAGAFEKVRQGVTAERDIRELDLIICLSKAWHAMSRGEAESSPELYEEAASLFEQAKDLSPSDKVKNTALGHSRFCRALAAGCRFSDSGDIALHDIAADNLESAARFYVKVGLDSAAECARASKLLFDAYVQMQKASRETDHERKAKFYALAEKILHASASSYDEAGQPGRKDQVLRLLSTVKRDRELAVSLSEVLQAPDATSNAMAIPSPTPTHETAAGLDRFDHAEIQATFIVRPRQLQVGQELSLEIELVNTGRGAAQLTKVDRIMPEGFNLVTEPEHCRIEDNHLNLRGKRLESMTTEDIKVVVKPATRGKFTLSPRVTYLDDTGKYKSSEPEPVEISVTELGIVGWLKGSERKR